MDGEFFSLAQPTETLAPVKPTHRILVVDEDEDLRHLLAHLLILDGDAVDAAQDGAQAWELLQLNHYDLLIADSHLTISTGMELLAKMRIAHMELPVIMITDAAVAESFAESPGLAPDAVLIKPVIEGELLQKVNTLLAEGFHEKSNSRPNWQNHTEALSDSSMPTSHP